jgi:hypothetical protein
MLIAKEPTKKRVGRVSGKQVQNTGIALRIPSSIKGKHK